MAIPLVPLFAGAVIGGLVTYIYKDEKTRSAMSRTAEDVSEKVKDTASTISGKVSDGVGGIKNKFSKQPSGEQEAVDSSEAEVMVAEDSEMQSAAIEEVDSEIEQGELIDPDKSEDK